MTKPKTASAINHKPVISSFESFIESLGVELDRPKKPLGSDSTSFQDMTGTPLQGSIKGALESLLKNIGEGKESIGDDEPSKSAIKEQLKVLFEPREKRYRRGPIKPEHELKWSSGRRTPGRGRYGKRGRVRPSQRKIVFKKLHYKQRRKYKSNTYKRLKALGRINTKGVTDIRGTYGVFVRNVRRDYKREITRELRKEVLLRGGSWETRNRQQVKKRVEKLVEWEFKSFREEDWIAVWLACGWVLNREGERVLAFKARSKFKKGGTRLEKIDKYSPYSLKNVIVRYERRDVLYPKPSDQAGLPLEDTPS